MANILQKAYYSLPGNQGAGEDAWRGTNKTAGGGGGDGGWGTAPQTSKVTQDDSAWNKLVSDNNALIASLKAQQAATPKLAKFDVMGNWTQAKSAAERAWNPVYEDQLNKYLANNLALKASKERNFNLTLDKITGDKANTLAENQLGRTRTAEDTANAIGQINTKEGQFQTDEGQSFDQNYRQVAEQLGASGAATTGMGKQQTYDAIKLRNVTSQRQLDEFQGQRQAKELFKTRTFEDLTRGDAEATRLATNQTKANQFDLEDYLQNLAYDEQNKRFDIEMERQGKVLSEAQTQEQAGVEQFLAGLAGQGYKASDIAYNRSVYA